jgi:glycosyltransferase involved in cell wall biosynthesis
LAPEDRGFILHKKPQTTFIQRLPLAKSRYRSYLPLMPLAIKRLDVSGYDLILSSSHAVAKGITTGPDQLHLSYVHSPMRYAWDLQRQYLQDAGLDEGIRGAMAKILLHYLRIWDKRSSNDVDYFAANSSYIAGRIAKAYGRASEVIYPPVDVEYYRMHKDKEDFYLTVSRLVPYKKVGLLAEAFNAMPEKRLVVIGDGPEFEKIKKMAKGNIKLMGYQKSEVLREMMQKAKAFVFAAEEDFGITPLEAQACGTPVIAYGRGGALETVLPLGTEKPTGIFFKEQTAESIQDAVACFEKERAVFTPESCRENALRFSAERFRESFARFVNDKIEKRQSKHL